MCNDKWTALQEREALLHSEFMADFYERRIARREEREWFEDKGDPEETDELPEYHECRHCDSYCERCI